MLFTAKRIYLNQAFSGLEPNSQSISGLEPERPITAPRI
jgi:hypothetical protein